MTEMSPKTPLSAQRTPPSATQHAKSRARACVLSAVISACTGLLASQEECTPKAPIQPGKKSFSSPQEVCRLLKTDVFQRQIEQEAAVSVYSKQVQKQRIYNSRWSQTTGHGITAMDPGGRGRGASCGHLLQASLVLAMSLTLDWGDSHWQGLLVPVFWDEMWEEGTLLSLLRQHLAMQPRLALDS